MSEDRDITEHETVVRVKRLLKVGGEKVLVDDESEEGIYVRKFVVPPAKVSLGKGVTVNIAKYESAKVDVHISVPCYVEEIEEVFAAVDRWVNEKVGAETLVLQKFRDEKKRRGA